MLVSPLVIIVLATLAMVQAIHDRMNERVLPRLVFIAVYSIIWMHPDLPEWARQFLVRWSVFLLFFVEVLYWTARKIISRRGN